ncbi:hypothetical protein P8864_18250 [Priestia flexa]|uniref:hypothetical protein n=1 Tax=Priestia flexa TaxID=86664 RepID=UPI000C239FD5|nr:hypothetical protein [Priestia flexa]MEC0667797.1 hypothetical protein [Priestia flexa]MED3825708.1 hypothetical protein [Priestia flexa]
MSSVEEAVYIHCGTKIGVFKPEEITKFSYMHSRGFFACPGCSVKVFHKRQNGQPTFVVSSTRTHAYDCLYKE